MASSSVMSSGLGVCRGYFVGKSSVIRQLTSVSTENHLRSRRNCCCFVNQRNLLFRGQRCRQGKLLLPLLSLVPTTTTTTATTPTTATFGIHGERSQSEFLDSSPICRASPSGNVGLLLEEEIEDDEAFVEVGYIADTHGVHGELHVHSLTDFPEERFEKPGLRWLRTRSMGRPSLQQVELLKGRVGPGKRPSWLITLKNVTTPEKASELVGSTMLVSEEKRPVLDEDEFYVPELVGMTVALQESREEIGVVLDVFSTRGGNDLLQVRLKSSTADTDGRKIWVPFVKEIVPVVNHELKRIEIAPPEGLLELNAPAKSKDEKDSNKKNFKERRKLRGKLGGLKKRLIAMGQTHVFAGLSIGTKEERGALLEQLLSIDFGILQQALEEGIVSSNSLVRPPTTPYTPEPPSTFPKVNWQKFDQWMDLQSSSTESTDRTEDNVDMKRWWREGLQLIADGKVAVVVLAGGQSTRLGQSAPPVKGMVDLGLSDGKSLFQQQAERLLLVQELASLVVDPEFNPFIPWIIMTSDATDIPTRQYFQEKDFFGLDESQVWFVKQDSMPCISLRSPEGQYDILMETPWKVAQAPNGNGGLFSALHVEGTIDRLMEEGIEYLQVYAVDNALVRVADPVFFGYTKDREADVGVKVVTKVAPEEAVGVVCLQRDGCVEDEETGDSSNSMDRKVSTSHYEVLEYSEMPEDLRHAYEKSGEVEGSPLDNQSHDGVSSTSRERPLRFRAAHICVNIFSVEYLKRLGESGFEFKFHTALKRIPHVKQQEDKEWVQVVPEAPNGMKLELYIFDAFKYCDKDKVALLEVHRNEEFAPVKNAAGPGIPDTVDTARELVLGLQRQLSSSTVPNPQSPQHRLIKKILVAYLGGHVDKDVLELLDSAKDENSS
ncbi:unnamed protein product [Calypogeia fissa]